MLTLSEIIDVLKEKEEPVLDQELGTENYYFDEHGYIPEAAEDEYEDDFDYEKAPRDMNGTEFFLGNDTEDKYFEPEGSIDPNRYYLENNPKHANVDDIGRYGSEKIKYALVENNFKREQTISLEGFNYRDRFLQ